METFEEKEKFTLDESVKDNLLIEQKIMSIDRELLEINEQLKAIEKSKPIENRVKKMIKISDNPQASLEALSLTKRMNALRKEREKKQIEIKERIDNKIFMSLETIKEERKLIYYYNINRTS
jgi:hypothetical protein